MKLMKVRITVRKTRRKKASTKEDVKRTEIRREKRDRKVAIYMKMSKNPDKG